MSSITGVNKTMTDLKRAVSAKRLSDIITKLADEGAEQARTAFSLADYDGGNDVEVSVKSIAGGKAVVARGKSVLFIEYGSGMRYGYGHPEPLEYGPGTWSEGPNGKGHWKDPHGWFIPGTRMRTYGNPPAMAMYEAGKEMVKDLPRIVRENLK